MITQDDVTTPQDPPDEATAQTTVDDPGPGRGSRALLFAAAALVLVLLGAAGGMFIASAKLSGGNGSPTVDSVDVGFAQDMRVHHMQAVTMATIARENSTDTAVRTLAFDIEGEQLTQIGIMYGWLTLWDMPPIAERDKRFAWLPDDGHGSGHGNMSADMSGSGMSAMPGMATTEEINRLRSLTGRALDVYFLQLMLRHHQGGLPMARYAAEHASTTDVRIFAEKVVRGQTNDNKAITDMLTARGAQPLPPPG